MGKKNNNEDTNYIEFHHGALCDTYEKQANDKGYTFGKDTTFVQDVGFGIIASYIHGVITESEYEKILHRFQKKILIKKLKKLSKNKDNKSYARWIKHHCMSKMGSYYAEYECSECGRVYDASIAVFDYCPKCGTYLGKEEQNG
jgi:hypothetical protein